MQVGLPRRAIAETVGTSMPVLGTGSAVGVLGAGAAAAGYDLVSAPRAAETAAEESYTPTEEGPV